MSIRQREIRSAIALIVLTVIGFHLTSRIDLSFSSDLERFTGPRAYPRMILGVMLVLSVLILVRALRMPRREPGAARLSLAQLSRIGGALFAIAVFVAFFKPLGYILSMPLLMIAVAALNGAKRVWPVVLTAVVATAICLVLFRYGLNTVLPEGLLGIDQIL